MKRNPTQLSLAHTIAAVALLAAAVWGTALESLAAEPAGWLGPVGVAASPDGKRAFVALADAKQVAAVDLAQGTVAAKVDLPDTPTTITADPAATKLFVTCGGAKGVVCVIDAAKMQIVQSLPVGHTPTGAAIAPDGSRLFVCNRFNNDVSVLSLSDGKEIARVKVVREPVAAAITPDGKTVFVANLLPDEAASSDASAAVVSVIDAASLATAEIRLPVGSSSVRGVCVSPDGKYAFATHILAHNALPTTQLERGWMNTNVVSIFDAEKKTLVDTVLFDDVDLGAANPWGVACSQDGATLCVAHSGTHELSVVNLKELLVKLAKRWEKVQTTKEVQVPPPPVPTGNQAAKWDTSVVSLPLGVSYDLSFLGANGLRRRVKLSGNGPRGLAVAGGKVIAAMYYSDALAVADLGKASSAATIALGPAPQWTEARRGDMLFHDATYCFQHWQSCASCHPDARADALNWDLMNDGYGNPKNTKSMLHSHRTAPAMSESVRETAEMAVRAGFRGILFMECKEQDATAVDTYLKSLSPTPSPHLVNGELNAAAKHGKELFESKRIGCAECHPAPLFTDMKSHNVGTRASFDQTSSFDTPTLIETWRTAPYLHDGSYRTMLELLGKGKHGRHGEAAENITEQELADLVEYVLSL